MLDTHYEVIPVSWNINKVEAASEPRAGSNSSFGLSTYYSNGLALPVVLTMRNGLSVFIPPGFGTGRYSQDFTIQARYNVGRGVNLDVAHLLDEVDDVKTSTASVELKAIKTALSKAVISPISKDTSFGLDFHVSKADLEGSGGVVYVEELDIVVSYGVEGKLPIHPYSTLGKNLKLTEDERFKTGKSGFLFSIELVDNKKLVGDKFINYCGHVYRVPAMVDNTRIDGYYVTSTPTLADKEGGYKVSTRRLSHLDAAKTFSIYSSAEQAETFGDPEKAREMEFKTREHELKERKLKVESELKERDHELNILKSKLAEQSAKREAKVSNMSMELAEKQKELALIKAELDKRTEELKHERELTSIRNKDYYENRSLDRKDSSELLKWIPNILIGIGAAAMGFKAIF